MKKYDSAYLIPTSIKSRKVGDSTLNYKNLEDITFEQFLNFFFARLGETSVNWHWLHARQDAVMERAFSHLLGFCDDPEKIRATQAMLYVMVLQPKFCDFILNRKAPYDEWAKNQNGDQGIKMIKALRDIVTKLHSEFEAFPGDTKKPLEPFSNYIAELHSGQLLRDVNEFINYFEKPLELTFLIGEYAPRYSSSSFNNFSAMYYQYKNNPEGSYNRTEKMRYGIDGFEMVAHFFDGEKKIAIEEYSYMQGIHEDKDPHCLIGIPKSFMVEVLGLSYEEFLKDFMPQYHEPLQMTLRIENDEGRCKLSYTISEPVEDIVLDFVPEKQKEDKTKYLKAKMISRPRTSTDKPKGERTAVQKSLLGKTKSKFTSDEFVYNTKVSYFNYFFSNCNNFMNEDFGRKLGELRYLAYVADQLRFASIVVPLVFPKILPPEHNSAHIVNGINPTLLFDPENKIEVVRNTIIFNDQARIAVITGPNQNGKSRYMDMIGLFHLMFQAGWPIPAEKAEMSPKTDLRVHYVHSGVGIMGESRFSNECLQLHKEFAYAKGDYPLFLIDEPYTGTNYVDAEQLLKEVLQACSEENATVFLTTHFHGLIGFVDSLPNGRNLHCVVNDDESFTFKISEGASTKSNALAVAERAQVRYSHIKDILKGKAEEVTKDNQPSPRIILINMHSEDDDLPF